MTRIEAILSSYARLHESKSLEELIMRACWEDRLENWNHLELDNRNDQKMKLTGFRSDREVRIMMSNLKETGKVNATVTGSREITITKK